MLKNRKFQQVALILFVTLMVLIVPNLGRLQG